MAKILTDYLWSGQYGSPQEAMMDYLLQGRSLPKSDDGMGAMGGFGLPNVNLPDVNIQGPDGPNIGLQGPNVNLQPPNVGLQPPTTNIQPPNVGLQPPQVGNMPPINLDIPMQGQLPDIGINPPDLGGVGLPDLGINLPDIGLDLADKALQEIGINIPPQKIPIDIGLGEIGYNWTDPLKSTLNLGLDLAPWKTLYDVGSGIYKALQGDDRAGYHLGQFRKEGADYTQGLVDSYKNVAGLYNEFAGGNLQQQQTLKSALLNPDVFLEGGSKAKGQWGQTNVPYWNSLDAFQQNDLLGKLNRIVTYQPSAPSMNFSDAQVYDKKVFTSEEAESMNNVFNQISDLSNQMKIVTEKGNKEEQ